ncbi:MAG TPA: hypothetical protein VF808_13190 [Ktedonobacterales bacterium]
MAMDGSAGAAPQRQLTPEHMGRAARAGEMIGAMTPGAPRGVIAGAGLPRATRLIARGAELDATLAALTTSEPPNAVALIGPSGVGKSALAAEVVALAAERGAFPGGVMWLPSEGLSGDPGLAALRQELANALGGARGPDAPPALLAFDHVEPPLDVAALMDGLGDENVAVLVTARQPLLDERITETPLAPLDEDAAAKLLRHALQQADPRRPAEGNEPLIVGAAHMLGGLPLVIGLTAARVAIMSLPLNVAQDAGPSRLRDVFDWAWESLPAHARLAFAGLALIEGATFPRGAALAVVGAAHAQTDGAGSANMADEAWRAGAAATLDALVGLRLIDPLASGRLRLQVPIRQYAARRLGETPEEWRDALGDALAAWWLDFARRQEGHAGAATLDVEGSGLIGALTWAHARDRRQSVLDLVDALSPAWRARRRATDLRQALAWSVSAAHAAGDAAHLRRALHDLALHDASVGRIEDARAGFAEALRVASGAGDAEAAEIERRAVASLPALPEAADQA